METVTGVCELLFQCNRLAFIGFTTDFSLLGKAATVQLPWIVAENQLAQVALNLVLCLFAKRCGSMSWHSDQWPGMLGLLCSPLDADVRRCIEELRTDYRVWEEAVGLAGASLFIRNIVRDSPFSTTFMQELGALVSAVADPMSDPELLQSLKTMSRRIWLGRGHTKMIEDGNREMRDREARDTTNKSMNIMKLWDVLRSRRIMELRRREEIVADVADPDLATAQPIDPNMFSARGHSHSTDGLHITDRMGLASIHGAICPGIECIGKIDAVLLRE
jgi:hypothetical protein